MTRFAGASVQGAAHKLYNKPNQDAFGGVTLGDWVVLTVSDGHGAARHFRSDRGSSFAVEAAQTAIGELKNKKAPASLREFPERMLSHWRKLVAADVKADPIGRDTGEDVTVAYGATCLTFCAGPGFAFYAQIGDGDMVVGADEGLSKPLPDDQGLVGEQTYSLCQPDAAAHFRVVLHQSQDLATPGFVLLASDGLSKSYRGSSKFMDVVQQLSDLAASQDMEGLSTHLVPWLDDVSAHGVGDDTTVMIFRDMERRQVVTHATLADRLKRLVGLK